LSKTITLEEKMPSNRLYNTIFKWINQQWPGWRVTQKRNLAWLLVGIYLAKSVLLSKIALEIPGQAVEVSVIKRLSRFLGNPVLQVRTCYDPLVQPLLQSIAQFGCVRLIVDGTKVGPYHKLLMVSVAYRRRAIPVAWTWVPHVRGHSSARCQLGLLQHVRRLLPSNTKVLLVGDAEFGSIEVLRQLDQWQWQYVLRQKSNHSVQLPGKDWQDFGSLVKKGQSLWLGKGLLTNQHQYAVNLLAHWHPKEDTPWLLATNLDQHHLALRAYSRRMWTEEMFGDLKGHGFDLESSHLKSFVKLSRLTFAVVLLYVWSISYGSYIAHTNQRRWVDRSDRGDLSIFQVGFRMIQRIIKKDMDIHLSFFIALRFPNLKLSGG
jgi:hypothetical protein